jgi:hypothetical protein
MTIIIQDMGKMAGMNWNYGGHITPQNRTKKYKGTKSSESCCYQNTGP